MRVMAALDRYLFAFIPEASAQTERTVANGRPQQVQGIQIVNRRETHNVMELNKAGVG